MTLSWNLVVPWWALLLLIAAGSILIARWYWIQTANLKSPWNWLLPTLRATVFVLLVAMLAGPTISYRQVNGELSRIAIVVDTSKSMSTSIASKESSDSKKDHSKEGSRAEIAQDYFLRDADGRCENSLLERLTHSHQLTIYPTTEKQLWDSQMDAIPFEEDLWTSSDAKSPIGESLKRLVSQLAVDNPLDNVNDKEIATSSVGTNWDAIVLVSDGQNNSGVSIVDVATSSGKRVPLFTVGVGDEVEPMDLAIVEMEVSSAVRREDMLRGTVRIKESMPSGLRYRVSMQHADHVLWEQEITSVNRGVFSLPFQFRVESAIDLIESNQSSDFERRAVPLDMKCTIESDQYELSKDNNAMVTSTWGVIRQNRVLLMDPIGGWETRYVRNALDRDPSWEVNAYLGPHAFESPVFPKTRQDLFDFDLVIASLEALESAPEEFREWLQDYLAFSAGGLIALDSVKQGQQLSPSIYQLLPIQSRSPNRNAAPGLEVSTDSNPISSPSGSMPSFHLRLAPIAMGQPAFQFETDTDANRRIWDRLLAPHAFQDLTLKPGAESLIDGVDTKGNSVPLMVTTRIGQGRVIYCASDETWRWRYGVSDLYHQRFWNQLSGWVMRQPFMVRGDFVALDAGSRLKHRTDSIPLRAKVVGEDRLPIELDKVQVDILSDGKHVSSVELRAQENSPGYFEGSLPIDTITSAAANEEFTVRLHPTGLPDEAKQISTSFWLAEEPDREMERVRLDAETLRKAADLTGGTYMPVSESDRLFDLLENFSRGKVVEKSYPLWQSFPWFAIIMTLLSVEWWLRKKVGLV